MDETLPKTRHIKISPDYLGSSAIPLLATADYLGTSSLQRSIDSLAINFTSGIGAAMIAATEHRSEQLRLHFENPLLELSKKFAARLDSPFSTRLNELSFSHLGRLNDVIAMQPDYGSSAIEAMRVLAAPNAGLKAAAESLSESVSRYTQMSDAWRDSALESTRAFSMRPPSEISASFFTTEAPRRRPAQKPKPESATVIKIERPAEGPSEMEVLLFRRTGETESKVRRVIVEVLAKNVGANWEQVAIDRKMRERWEYIRADDAREIGCNPNASLIESATFKDYRLIIKAHWSLFQPFFVCPDSVEVRFRFVAPRRNRNMHFRAMNSREMDTVLGDLQWILRQLEKCGLVD